MSESETSSGWILQIRGRSLAPELTRCVVSIDPARQIEARVVTEDFSRLREIGFGPGLEEAVGVLEILGRQIRLKHAIELLDDLVIREGAAATDVEYAGCFALHRREVGSDDIIDINKIAALLAIVENPRALAGPHLGRELADHAGEFGFVSFAGAIHIEVAQADDRMR